MCISLFQLLIACHFRSLRYWLTGSEYIDIDSTHVNKTIQHSLHANNKKAWNNEAKWMHVDIRKTGWLICQMLIALMTFNILEHTLSWISLVEICRQRIAISINIQLKHVVLYTRLFSRRFYFRGGFIFANFASQPSRKFPLQYIWLSIVMKTSQKSRN